VYRAALEGSRSNSQEAIEIFAWGINNSTMTRAKSSAGIYTLSSKYSFDYTRGGRAKLLEIDSARRISVIITTPDGQEIAFPNQKDHKDYPLDSNLSDLSQIAKKVLDQYGDPTVGNFYALFTAHHKMTQQPILNGFAWESWFQQECVPYVARNKLTGTMYAYDPETEQIIYITENQEQNTHTLRKELINQSETSGRFENILTLLKQRNNVRIIDSARISYRTKRDHTGVVERRIITVAPKKDIDLKARRKHADPSQNRMLETELNTILANESKSIFETYGYKPDNSVSSKLFPQLIQVPALEFNEPTSDSRLVMYEEDDELRRGRVTTIKTIIVLYPTAHDAEKDVETNPLRPEIYVNR